MEDISRAFQDIKAPILVLSTSVGRGVISVGDGIVDILKNLPGIVSQDIKHLQIEGLLSEDAVNEDKSRYHFICNKCPSLLYLIYKIPFFYWRKLRRELSKRGSNLEKILEEIESFKPATIITVSHRPTFWASVVKQKHALNLKIISVSIDLAPSLGWKFILWKNVNRIISMLSKDDFKYLSHEITSVDYRQTFLPVKNQYLNLVTPGDSTQVLLVGGYWGLGPIIETVTEVLSIDQRLVLHVCCGSNMDLLQKLKLRFENNLRVKIYGELKDLYPLYELCAVVIGRPGISTILESHIIKRKLFLLNGLPVAEQGNAKYAVKNKYAEFYSKENFIRWLEESK